MSQRPPSMVTYGRIDHIVTKIKEAATPDRFTGDFLREVIGAKGTNDQSFIRLSKRCGLLSEDGSPTDRYKKLRSTTLKVSQGAMAEAIKEGYSEIYALNEYAHQLDENDFRGLVLQQTGLEQGNASVGNIVKTFQALKKHANFDASSAGGGKKEEPVDPKPPFNGEIDSNLKLGLSYQINLILPKTDDIAVFNAIFKSLKDNLLRK